VGSAAVDDRDMVWRAMSRLPWRQRAALVLRYYEDLSVDQTADVLRCSRRAADGLISRGLAALRVDIGTEDGP
jgi:DNA-directed RNA polymerase specialized sigma24 family protein